MRLCSCGAPAVSSRHKYCAACRDNADREYTRRNRELSRKADTPEKRRARRSRDERPAKERGYDSAHARERKRWGKLVATGDVLCARCGLPIDADAPWHLDHTDDREAYLGPSHARCNMSAATGRDLTPSELERRRELRRDGNQKASSRSAALYNREHRRRRAKIAREVALGTARCVRCLGVILPTEPWDLGHDDLDWGTHYGPEHRNCNRSAGAKRATTKEELAVVSRQWIAG